MRRAVLIVGLLISLLGGLWWLYQSPSVQLFGEVVHRVETENAAQLPRVALTFDDGPSAAFTPLVLDKLAALNVRGTFFLNGAEMQRHPATAASIVAAGHELGNHSYSHARMLLRSQSWIGQEIETTDQLIRRAGYQNTIHFRPPYGRRLVTLPWYLARNNRLTVTWDVDGDPYPTEDTAADISSRVLNSVRPGSIILLHVMWNSRQASRDALEPIVLGLRKQGYELVTLSELLD